METTIIVALISASASIIAAAITFSLTKRKEREADWRKQKLDHYKEFLTALSGTVGTDATPEGQIRFARACNTLVLVASQKALNALRALQDEIRISNQNKSPENHDKLLAELLLAIRVDMGITPADDPRTFTFQLWCSGLTESLPEKTPLRVLSSGS